MPLAYPEITIIINTGLLPATVFVLNALMIDIGQLTPKQTSIRVSKILIISRFLKISVYYR
jgi:hypothetical protein